MTFHCERGANCEAIRSQHGAVVSVTCNSVNCPLGGGVVAQETPATRDTRTAQEKVNARIRRDVARQKDNPDWQ